MAQPVDAPARHDGGKAAKQAGEQTSVDADNALAQRIWGRYGGSPGVLPIDATLGLARRISRWSTGRLPLLAEVQRRWAPSHLSFPRGAFTLPYARLPVLAGPQPPSTYVAQPTPGRAARSAIAGARPSPGGRISLQRAAPARPAAGAPPPRISVSKGQPAYEIQAAAEGGDLGTAILRRHLSGPGGRAIQRQGAPSRLARTKDDATAGSPQRAGPPVSTDGGALQSGGGEAQHAAEARTVLPTARGASDLGTAILRRHLSGPAGRAIQRQRGPPEPMRPEGRAASESTPRAGPVIAAKSTARAGPVASTGQGASQPEGGGAQHAAEAWAMPPTATSAGDLGAVTLRQHLSGPAGRAVQRQGAPPEPAPPQGRTTPELPVRARSRVSSSEGTLQPAGGEARPATGVRAAPPTATGAGDLGTTILQRHLNGPAERAIRRRGAAPGAARADLGMSQQSFARGRAEFAMPQRVLPAHLALEALPVAGQPATIEGTVDQAAPPVATSVGQSVETSAASGSGAGPTAAPGPGWTLLSRTVDRVGETSIMRRPAMPLSRTALPGGGMVSMARDSGGEAYAASQEMPLLRLVDGGAVGPGGESARLVSAPSSLSGTPVGLPLQRAAAGAPVATPAPAISGPAPSQPAGEPSSPTAATPGLEGPDLERLADKVYTIIERRLIIERESLGL